MVDKRHTSLISTQKEQALERLKEINLSGVEGGEGYNCSTKVYGQAKAK